MIKQNWIGKATAFKLWNDTNRFVDSSTHWNEFELDWFCKKFFFRKSSSFLNVPAPSIRWKTTLNQFIFQSQIEYSLIDISIWNKFNTFFIGFGIYSFVTISIFNLHCFFNVQFLNTFLGLSYPDRNNVFPKCTESVHSCESSVAQNFTRQTR